MSKKLMVDLDSIVVDSLGPWLAAYNKEFGDDLTVARVNNWDFKGCLKPECTDMFKYIREPGFFYNCEPLPGAIDALHRLKALKVNGKPALDIVVCTAALHPQAYYDKSRWYDERLDFLGGRQLTFAHRKEWFFAWAYLDDGPKNLEAIRYQWPHAKLLTIDYPYNRDLGVDYGNGREKFEVDFRALDFADTVKAWEQTVGWIESNL